MTDLLVALFTGALVEPDAGVCLDARLLTQILLPITVDLASLYTVLHSLQHISPINMQ